MINKAVVAGRVTRDPQLGRTPGGVQFVDLVLELEHLPWGHAETEVCELHARAYGEGRSETLTRYVQRDRFLALSGFLRADDERMLLIVDQFQFLERGLTSRPLWEEARVPVGTGTGG